MGADPEPGGRRTLKGVEVTGTGRGRRGPRRAVVLGAFLLLALLGGAWFGWHTGGPPDLSAWDEAIDRAARRSGVDGALLRAMVAAESGGRANATSGKGARGLLQLMPSTAREEASRLGLPAGDEDALYEPETNLRLGASYMARLLERYRGNEVFALAAYNAGPTAVNRWRRRLPHLPALDVILREGYEETRRHVIRVLRWRKHYRR